MKTKFLLSSAVVIAGAATAAFVFWPTEKVAAAADPRTGIPFVSVVEATTPDTVARSFTGTIAPRVQSDLGFRVPGKIVERLVNLGDEVKAGQPLMKIDETDLRLALTAKRNAVAAAQATFVQAQADEKRFAALVRNLAASTQQYEKAKAALDTATAQLAAAKAEANVADNEATYTVLLADADGTIVETLGEPGQVVAAGQTVIRLAQAGAREALVWMPENLRPEIGATAQATVYGRDTKDNAVLRQISASAETRTRTYETRWVLQGGAATAPLGATVTIKIPNKDAQTHAEVPIGALLDDGNRSGIWVVDKSSTVHFRELTVERLGEEDAIVSGLKPGEVVVALGAHLLTDGATIRTGVENAEAAK
ncbi:efflux transporter periplasmic adaptor subunit [Rhizobium leguminosarum bv. trifolii]|uniref:Efflux transporter periplasmic adaptor subunit n=1 Tax=Rhizobium leguminosarum bv. trifolii TaxID=386 RepID=A0A3E1BG12_RHILT|nr:efflux RND transporter periplasmic adaptor subunit [Rhizobium leguminosarum]RFB90006.1 efflux transporter periplasmic adaptor subunit [Rhizobium leguminosarum bv. trifolii]RFB91327.1 efflux transporter periplasmic adaptor subunit [Rhizobium leguminosarum bv. trifolii]RFB92974.1 efflux transporter periplasmic adaptor subunit [Rhizobium leguminosarum bv. trifolii]RFB93439.1 efflux transporter periplasmic adaptor subunit [Rhizobium leguminosarum bv. trifolii]